MVSQTQKPCTHCAGSRICVLDTHSGPFATDAETGRWNRPTRVLRAKMFIKPDSSLSIRLSIKTKIAAGFHSYRVFLEWWGLQRAREFREAYKRLGKHKQTNLRSVVWVGYSSHATECWDSLHKHYQLTMLANNNTDNEKKGLRYLHKSSRFISLQW